MIALVPRDSLIGVVIGPTIWIGYFVVAYAIAGLGCGLGYGGARLAGMGAIQLLLLVVGGISAVVIVAAGVQAELRRRRAAKSAAPSEHAAATRERHRFLFAATVLLCGLSFVGTLWVALAAVISPIC